MSDYALVPAVPIVPAEPLQLSLDLWPTYQMPTEATRLLRETEEEI